MQRWRKSTLNCEFFHNSKVPKRVVRAMETLEKALIQETNDLSKQIQQIEKLKQGEEKFVREFLELSYRDSSRSAAASDSKTHIQCTVNRISEFARLRKFYQLDEAIDDVIDQIKKHHKEFPSEKLENEVFVIIQQGLNTKKHSLKIIRESISNLENITILNDKSSWDQLRIWAENLEILGEEIEDHFNTFPIEFFNILEEFCETVVLKARQKATNSKGKNQNRREEWRRRVRYAAGFILNLIEIAREEAIQEDEEIIHDFFAARQPSFDNMWGDEGES